MTQQQAIERAELARSDHSVPNEWKLRQAGKRYIQLGSNKREEPSPVRDLLVWVVQFGGELSWIELAIEDRTGQIVRVERSR